MFASSEKKREGRSEGKVFFELSLETKGPFPLHTVYLNFNLIIPIAIAESAWCPVEK